MNCPKCESTNISKTPLKAFIWFVVAGISGFLTIIGFFFFPLLFLSIPLFFLSFVVFLLPMPNYKCEDCNKAYMKKKLTA